MLAGLKAGELAFARHWDHYAVLAVPVDFSKEQIRKVYRARSKEMHPDKQGGSDAAFQRVAEAYQVAAACHDSES